MRLEVRLYALLIIASAAALAVFDVHALSSWTYTWSPLAGLVLLALFVVAVHFQFHVHSGWLTDASTVPAVATALLLPPGVAILVAGLSLLVYAIGRRRLGIKGLFNAASAML